MAGCGLLFRFEAVHDKEHEAEQFLRDLLALAQQEVATVAWFAVRFGRFDYGIVEIFPHEVGRAAHRLGPIGKALADEVGTLILAAPVTSGFEVLIEKLPGTPAMVAKGMLLAFKAKTGHAQEVEQFLRDARSYVLQEAETSAWFAIRLDNGEYGIFDVFPDNGARFAHLTGHVPRELAKNALSLLGGMPHIDMLDVIAAKM